MKLKNITRQKIKPWYYIHVTRKEQHINKESEGNMREKEKKHAIEVAGKYIQLGADLEDIEDSNVKKHMKKIAANAVIIGLFNFNGFVISNICNGDFNTLDKERWKEIKNDLNRCLEIIDNEGENFEDILTSEEIKEAIKYTIFEETGESTEDE